MRASEDLGEVCLCVGKYEHAELMGECLASCVHARYVYACMRVCVCVCVCVCLEKIEGEC